MEPQGSGWWGGLAESHYCLHRAATLAPAAQGPGARMGVWTQGSRWPTAHHVALASRSPSLGLSFSAYVRAHLPITQGTLSQVLSHTFSIRTIMPDSLPSSCEQKVLKALGLVQARALHTQAESRGPSQSRETLTTFPLPVTSPLLPPGGFHEPTRCPLLLAPACPSSSL